MSDVRLKRLEGKSEECLEAGVARGALRQTEWEESLPGYMLFLPRGIVEAAAGRDKLMGCCQFR
jgi:hypothetical protein